MIVLRRFISASRTSIHGRSAAVSATSCAYADHPHLPASAEAILARSSGQKCTRNHIQHGAIFEPVPITPPTPRVRTEWPTDQSP